MNIMLVSVTERTREIGIRKALGARTRDVLIQFLTESAILSALGGIIGVVLAVTVVTAGGAAFGLPVVIRPGIIILAVSFSAVVGIFFGIYPASKAAKADPIDALRYESFLEYAALAAGNLILDNMILGILVRGGIPLYVAKVMTECTMFLFSWIMQHQIIFRKRGKQYGMGV